MPTFPGRFGRGFDFGSANPVTQSVTVPNNPALEPASVTVAAWVKHNGFPGEKQYIVGKGATDCSASSYALYTGYSAPPPGHLGLQFYTWNGTKGATTTPIADNTIWDGKWHAVAGTFDGTAAHLYVDGHEVGTGTPALGPITYGLPTSSRLRFGGYDGDCSLPYTGGLDEVRIYNRALSAAEIARLQNPAATTPPEVDTATPPPPGGFKVTLSSQKPLTAGKAGLLVPTPTTGVKIKHYVWDLNGDGKTDADCAGSTPELAPEYPGLYTGLVKVTAITTGGLRTSTVLPVKVGAGTPAPRASALRALGRRVLSHLVPRKASGSYLLSTCKPIPHSPLIDITPNAGPTGKCSSTMAVADVLSAIGCFHRVKPEDVPHLEQAQLAAVDARFAAKLIGAQSLPKLRARSASLVSDALALRRALGGLNVANDAVRINGIDFVPVGFAHIVLQAGQSAIDEDECWMVSSDVSVRINGVEIRRGPLVMSVPLSRGSVHVATRARTSWSPASSPARRGPGARPICGPRAPARPFASAGERRRTRSAISPASA